MRRRLFALLTLIFLPVCPAAADVPVGGNVDLFPSAANYVGPCPVDIVFTATLSGDYGTIFGYHFYGGGFNTTKELYGYIPDSGSFSLENDVLIDAAHAGKITRSVEVKFEKRSTNGYTATTVKSASAEAVVTCSNAAASPAPTTASSGGGRR